MKRNYMILIVIIIFIIVGFIWFVPKMNSREGFEVFGATKIAARPYMQCINECEKVPRWQKLDQSNLVCSNRCNDIVSDIVRQRAESSSVPYPAKAMPTISTSCTTASKPTRGLDRIHNYCVDECSFNQHYKLGGNVNECIKICTINTAPDMSWGDWAWH